jgi:glycosyltransferase involved in cell wall biosynthesis
MTKKKILFMITKGNFGGAQRYVFDLATNLPKDKFDVAVALGEGETLEKKLKERGIRVIKIESLKRDISVIKDVLAFFEIIKILKNERPEIIHLNSSKMGALGGLAGRIVSIQKILFTGHGWAFNEERNIFSKILIAKIHWFTILLSHHTIAVSERIKEQFRFFPFAKSRIVLIHNGIDSINFLPKDLARKNLVEGQENSIWIGTIAELHKNKGIDFVIKAFAEIKDEFRNAIFVIIGEGEEKASLEKLIKEHNLVDRVFLVGFKTDANTLLKAFDIGILTSRTDTFPYVPLEMGLAELPFIGSWVGGIPEIVVNGESGILVQNGEVSEIADAIRTLLKDSELRKGLGNNLKERVHSEFTLAKMLEKTMRLYEH